MMVDDGKFNELCEAVARIDERTERMQGDVAALTKVVLVGNGEPSLVSQVARLDVRLDAGLESRAAKWKVKGIAITAASGLLIALIGLLGKAC